MFRCVICRFEVELDDAVAVTRRGACICIRCFARETNTEHPMAQALWREIEAAAGG